LPCSILCYDGVSKTKHQDFSMTKLNAEQLQNILVDFIRRTVDYMDEGTLREYLNASISQFVGESFEITKDLLQQAFPVVKPPQNIVWVWCLELDCDYSFDANTVEWDGEGCPKCSSPDIATDEFDLTHESVYYFSPNDSPYCGECVHNQLAEPEGGPFVNLHNGTLDCGCCNKVIPASCSRDLNEAFNNCVTNLMNQ